MQKTSLEGKSIPTKYQGSYQVSVSPIDKGDKDKSPRSFSFIIAIDTLDHVYVLPSYEKAKDGKIFNIPIYGVEDVIEAALGNEEKKRVIDTYRAMFQEEYSNAKMLIPRWNNALLDQARELVHQVLNELKAARGEVQNAEDEVPEDTTNYEELSLEEAMEIAKTAKPL